MKFKKHNRKLVLFVSFTLVTILVCMFLKWQYIQDKNYAILAAMQNQDLSNWASPASHTCLNK